MEDNLILRKYRTTTPNYDKTPFIQVSDHDEDCILNWSGIIDKLLDTIGRLPTKRKAVVIETYHGIFLEEFKNHLIEKLKSDHVIDTNKLFKTEAELDLLLKETLGDHPIFGYLSDIKMQDFFDPEKLWKTQKNLSQITEGVIVIYGPGAFLIEADTDLFIYADMARWEIQQRMRQKRIANLGTSDFELNISLKYKRAYFVDWRICDKIKRKSITELDFLLDTNDEHLPKMISGDSLRKGLKISVERPFRVVPFFDPGVWGGQWMREVCQLSDDPVNFAWCFDCVPEENSLLLAFGDRKIEIPSINLVFDQPLKLLGEKIYHRFGAEFPIRFDFLDTMDGGNLSLQVHPLQAYMQAHFGIPYTQDESYYLLDVEDDAMVYLGLQEDIDREQMIDDLERAEKGEVAFNADKYIQKWPVKKHDHILIPAGTIHCSGKNSMVLEISATPYIFTFKLWDWGRVDLDGKPRPISLAHGKQNIKWDRTTQWVESELVNNIQILEAGDGWREERTGLHRLEFIETRRHWFSKKVTHDTQGNLNVLNLVEGDQVVVESPTNAFDPFVVHFAETFIVPAAVGIYTIRPVERSSTREYATIKAYVR